jgi:broad specificity phosphatase PhoE
VCPIHPLFATLEAALFAATEACAQEFGDWDNMDDVNMQTENPRRYKALLQVACNSTKRSKKRNARFASPALQAKDAYNKFYFRYPNGESRADVVQRAALFTSKLFRQIANFAHAKHWRN